jgi:hypothetical protein
MAPQQFSCSARDKVSGTLAMIIFQIKIWWGSKFPLIVVKFPVKFTMMSGNLHPAHQINRIDGYCPKLETFNSRVARGSLTPTLSRNRT